MSGSITVFQTSIKDYKHFLKLRLASPDPFPVTQAALARAAGCKPSYLSQCLNGKVHLLPEQLHAIAEFLKMPEKETEYLLALLELERSGNSAHRGFTKKRLSKMKEEHDRLSNRLEVKTAPESPRPGPNHDLQAYYNDWFVIAVHMLCTLPGIRSPEDVALRLGLSPAQAGSALARLRELGLVEQKDGQYRATNHHLRIGDRDPLIGRHHANWRMQAALRSQPAPVTDLHYTAVYSLSRADARALREKLAQLILEVREKVKPSPEECVAAFGLDWFQLV